MFANRPTSGSGPDASNNFDKYAFSMRFANPQVEDAYLRSLHNQFCSNLSIMSVLAFLVSGPLFAARTLRYDNLDAAERVKTISLGWLACISITGIFVPLPCIKRRATHRILEAWMTLCMASHLFNAVFAEPQLLQAIFNFSTEDDDDPRFRVAYIALGLDTVVTAVSLAIPMRWFLIIWIDLAFAVSFIFFAMTVSGGNAEAVQICVLMVALTVAAGIGQRTMERKNRDLFGTIADERVLRAKAEFFAEQNSANKDRFKQDPTSDKASKVTMETTDTANMFQEAVRSGDFAELRSLGMQEQWLISDLELEVNKQELLGSGGCAMVYAGKFCNSLVAIKSHRTKDTAGRVQQDAAILNELRILRHLRHPNIALFHGAYLSEKDGGLLLVLERIHGKSLNLLISVLEAWRQNSPNAVTQVKIMLQVVNALIYLHSRQPAVVHADLKPSNILVERRDEDYVPKLLDFGLSRTVTRKAKLLGGTPQYVAPEVVLLKSAYQPRPACDVFSLGRLLFFVASGRVPLASVPIGKLLAMMREGKEPPPLSWTPGTVLLENQRSLIERCTAYDPERRLAIGEVYDLLSLTAPADAQEQAQRLAARGPDAVGTGAQGVPEASAVVVNQHGFLKL